MRVAAARPAVRSGRAPRRGGGGGRSVPRPAAGDSGEPRAARRATTTAGRDGAPQRWRGAADRGPGERRHRQRRGDHRRARCRTTIGALVVGDTTYGKGIVQTVFPLGPDLALRMTTARWYTPSGRSIQGAALDSVMGAATPAEATTTSRSGRPAACSRAGAGSSRRGARSRYPDHGGAACSRRRSDGQVPVFRDVLTAYALELGEAGRIRRARRSR